MKEGFWSATIGHIGWSIIYGYFALHLDNDPLSCLAFTEEHDSHEHAITGSMKKDGDYVDVGQTFRGAFTVQLMATLAIIGASLSPYYMKELNSAFFAL